MKKKIKTYSLGEEDVEMLKLYARSLHISNSAALRVLISQNCKVEP